MSLEAKAEELGLKSVSEYIRFLHDVFAEKEQAEEATLAGYPQSIPASQIRNFHSTKHGEILWGDARSFLFNKANPRASI